MSEYELDVDLEFRPIIWYLSRFCRKPQRDAAHSVGGGLNGALAHGTRVPAAPLFVRLITPADDETPTNEFHSIFLLLLAGSTRGSQNSQRLLELVV